MRLELSVSEQDRRLLMVTAIAGILILSVRFLIQPAFKRGQELERAITEISAVHEEHLTYINRLENLDEAIAQQRFILDEASKAYYKPLASWEMDALITELAVQHGLFPENLSLTEAVPGMVEPYIFAPEEGETSPEYDGVLLASARLEARGEAAQWQAFLDDIAWKYPGLRVTRFEVSPHNDANGRPDFTDRIVCLLEIYMCRKAREGE